MQKYFFVLLGILTLAVTGCGQQQVVGTVSEKGEVLVEDASGNFSKVDIVTVVDDSNNVRLFTNEGCSSAYPGDRYIFTVIKDKHCPVDDMHRITDSKRIDKDLPKMKHNEAKAMLMAKHLNGSKIELGDTDRVRRLEQENAELKALSEAFAKKMNEDNLRSPSPVVYGPFEKTTD